MGRLLSELDKHTRNKFIQWILDIINELKALFPGNSKQLREIKALEGKFRNLLTETKTVERKGNDGNKKYYLAVEETVNKAIQNKGRIDEPRNQKQISKVPDDLAEMVFAATNGKIYIFQINILQLMPAIYITNI